MKNPLLDRTRLLVPILASLALVAGVPVGANAYDDDFVRNVKVKKHKVKVKVEGGKAKIKHKRNGKVKVKIKGCSGDVAHDIAQEAAGCSGGHGGHGAKAQPTYYYK